MNLVHRWIKYLAANQTPVGHMIHSTLDETQFSSISPSGDWVLADGRNIEGSKFAQLTGRETVPDMRAMYPLMLDSELDSVEYNVVNESVARLDSALKYDKGNVLPFDGGTQPLVNYDISSVKMRHFQTNSMNQSTGNFTMTRSNNNVGGRFYYDQNDYMYDVSKAKRWLHDSNLNGTGYSRIESDNNAHSHEVAFGNYLSSSSQLPATLFTNSKINRSASKTVDVSFNDINRLIPKTYTVNIYIRIN